MTLKDVARIETIIRQGWYGPEDEEFGSWLGVDQDQALELLERIPYRLPADPRPLWPFLRGSEIGEPATEAKDQTK